MSQNAIESTKSVDSDEAEFEAIEYNYHELPCNSFVLKNMDFRRDKFVGKGSFSYCFSYRPSRQDDKVLIGKVSPIFDIKNRCPKTESRRKELWNKEVEIMRSLTHENIVKIYATKEVCCKPYWYIINQR